ncbi:chemotaxis protein CheW [Bacillus pinisoli]|uniref:chemotaxis protein CheW n=1 Tax=Bacillus pinisoli TaxID=2901866 RepID=UPI001FF147DA|nr:chemotaxis protein CheW [Bacillus pinisoli]
MTDATQIGKAQFVVFSVNQQLYSLSIEEVVEILRVPVITSIPGINEMIEGVINLRGSIIPVVSLHKRFNLIQASKHKKNRIVIVQGENENIGLRVEEVRMVTKFNADNVEPPPGMRVDEDIFIGFAKLDGQVIGILNLKKVLYEHQV